MYSDEFQTLLEKPLKRFFHNPENLTNLSEMKDLHLRMIYKYENERILYRSGRPFVCMFASLNKDGAPQIEVAKKDYGAYEKYKDMRLKSLIALHLCALEWIAKNNLRFARLGIRIPIYVWISDHFPYHFNSVPVFCSAKPPEINLPLMPDHSYACLQYEGKYKGQCVTWDDAKEILVEERRKFQSSKKPRKDQIYFLGAATSVHVSQLREKMANFSKKRVKLAGSSLDVSTDGVKNFVPLYKAMNKTFYLDLPGRYPWSNRFKYLFLTGGSVIKVRERWGAPDGSWIDSGPWEQFIDFVLSPDMYHTIDSLYIQYRPDSTERKEHNENEFRRVMTSLENIVKKIKSDPAAEKRRIKKAQQWMEQLSNDRIYQYIYRYLMYLYKLWGDEDIDSIYPKLNSSDYITFNLPFKP